MNTTASIRVTTSASVRDVATAALGLAVEKKARGLRLSPMIDTITAAGLPASDAHALVIDAALQGPGRAVTPGDARTFADVLHWQETALALYVTPLPPGGAAVELHVLGAPTNASTAAMGELLDALLGKHGGYRDAHENHAWLDRASEERVNGLVQSGTAPAAFREDVAQILQAPAVRASLARLGQGHVLVDAPDRDLDILAFAELARKQFVLTCSKAPDTPLLSFDEEDGLSLILNAKAHCPRCSEGFERRHVRLLYTLSDTGAGAATHAIRILYPVLKAFKDEGAPVTAFPVTRSGRAIGGLAYCAGLTVAVHAYDRDVVPEDALPVSDACLDVQPDVVVIATTSEVTEDAKVRFAEAVTTTAAAHRVRVQFFERFDPTRPENVRAWWQRTREARIAALLEEGPLAFTRALGLPPATLAEAAARGGAPAAARSLSPTKAQAAPAPTPTPAPAKAKGGRS